MILALQPPSPRLASSTGCRPPSLRLASSTSSTSRRPTSTSQPKAGKFNRPQAPSLRLASSTSSTAHRRLQPLQQAVGRLQPLQLFGHFPPNPYLCIGNMKQMKGTVPFPSLFHRRWQQKKKQFRLRHWPKNCSKRSPNTFW